MDRISQLFMLQSLSNRGIPPDSPEGCGEDEQRQFPPPAKAEAPAEMARDASRRNRNLLQFILAMELLRRRP